MVYFLLLSSTLLITFSAAFFYATANFWLGRIMLHIPRVYLALPVADAQDRHAARALRCADGGVFAGVCWCLLFGRS